MKDICFFCHFHNGDIFHIKSFLREIISEIDTKYYIAHPNSPIITSDMDMEYINIPVQWSKFRFTPYEGKENHTEYTDLLLGKERTKFIETEDCLFVNTWIGGYFSPDNEFNNECSLRGFHKMFLSIYEKINEVFGTELQLKALDEYLPFVDYSKIDCKNVDLFLEENTSEKILICNGPSLSGQTTYNTDMSEIINPLSEIHKDKTFICTKKFDTQSENIKFTDDIIDSDLCDLNQISYLSRSCYLTVGRNSGPFCFTITDQNTSDKNKTFLAFGTRATDCLLYGMDINCSFVFDYFDNIDKLYETISELI